MTTATVKQLVQSVFHDAERFRDTDAHEVQTLSVGDTWWQGDCGIQYLGNVKMAARSHSRLQLAEGDGEGSRHIAMNPIEGNPIGVCKAPAGGLAGWYLMSSKGIKVTHPVHGDVTLHEPGTYLIRFQRQLVLNQANQASTAIMRARD